MLRPLGAWRMIVVGLGALVPAFQPLPGQAQVDIVADRSYLRTMANGGGEEITNPSAGQSVYFHASYSVTGTGAPFRGNARALIDGVQHCAGEIGFEPGSSNVFVFCPAAFVVRC